MKKSLRLLLLSLCSILMAWTPVKAGSIKSDESIDKSKGVLLAAVTSDNYNQVLDVWYYFRKKGSKDENRLEAFGMFLLTRPNDYKDHKDKKGRLHAVSLEPGEYELYNWELMVTQAGGSAVLSPKQQPAAISFTIFPGKITYVGDLHVVSLKGKNFFGLSVPAGGIPVISDNSAEDISLLQVKYPTLQDWPVEKSVSATEKWQ